MMGGHQRTTRRSGLVQGGGARLGRVCEFVVALGLGAFGLASLPAMAVSEGEPLPAVSVPHIESGTLDNAGLTGKVTVVNFWATWCAACKVELLEMEDAFKPLATNPSFNMAFVSLDKDPQKASAWFQDNLKAPELFMKHLYIDSSFDVADKLKVDSFPMTFVIGPDGKVAMVQRGFKEGEGSTEKIAALAESLLKGGG